MELEVEGRENSVIFVYTKNFATIFLKLFMGLKKIFNLFFQFNIWLEHFWSARGSAERVLLESPKKKKSAGNMESKSTL